MNRKDAVFNYFCSRLNAHRKPVYYMKLNIDNFEKFVDRHNGPDNQQISEMLKEIGVESVEELINQTIPADIRLKEEMDLPVAKTEYEFIQHLRKIASKNKLYKNYIGLGYYNTVTPPVIQRNILENPGWYTAYTPYQAEISQGRLEALINFQTMIIDLTGMEIANASLLDEGTAAAEAMGMLHALRKGDKKSAEKFFVHEDIFPQVIDVLKTRSEPLGVELQIGSLEDLNLTDPELFGLYLQNPDQTGEVHDYTSLIASAKENDLSVAVGADLLSLLLVKSPGEMGADVVVGTSQRFGVPMGYGGPHAAYFATKEDFKRHIPGRIIGVSVDANGNNGYRMALQTREQHIRREKATSNICTAQVLLAVMAGMYAVYHGPKGLKNIASRVHGLTQLLAKGIKSLGYEVVNKNYFDTLTINIADNSAIQAAAINKEINLFYAEGTVGISLDEITTQKDVEQLLSIFAEAGNKSLTFNTDTEKEALTIEWEQGLIRTSDYLMHPTFNQHHSEHEMLRYMKSLENKDLSLVHSMISLGSCTMKLNATTEMLPVTWSEFSTLHPFVPQDQVEGYKIMLNDLEQWLSVITGFAAVSLQPNSGAQGEYAGLMVIRAYHESRGEGHRNVTLIPSSAHGTNPASAVMAGKKVVIVKCDEKGNIDINDLREKAEKHSENLSSLMVTYPSTHGVFEEGIREICEIIHQHGGQVYMDGANMNAQVGLTSPAAIGADVCHLNLHKTFCIPHGGGGPGMGPIGVAEQLKPFLPGNPVIKTGGEQSITAISSAPYGSASILTISYAYIALMGKRGLKKATEMAILNANYIKARLEGNFKVLYSGKTGRCAHEMIIDCREFKKAGIEVEDIAKRLMDYGFHAPTVSFPVPGTMMIEPTESEPKEELDKFCEAMIQIRKEIEEVGSGSADRKDNVLKNAPHTAAILLTDEWNRPYSREKAAFPLDYVRNSKFWPSVARVDSAYGDRNLMCSCIPVTDFEESEEQAV